MPDVFISHEGEDSARAASISDALVARGLDVTMEGEPENAKALLVLWSESSVVSEPIRGQARAAAARETLVSVQIEECRLPLEFRLIHTELLQEGAEGSDDPLWASILARIAELTANPPPSG